MKFEKESENIYCVKMVISSSDYTKIDFFDQGLILIISLPIGRKLCTSPPQKKVGRRIRPSLFFFKAPKQLRWPTRAGGFFKKK
jgi:hypothetical protein